MAIVRRIRSLRGRLFIVGGLLILAVMATASWSTAYFALLTADVEANLRASEKLLARSAALSSALEREDDALLLALAGSVDAQARLTRERERVDNALTQLARLQNADPQASLIASLRRDIIEYREDVNALLARTGDPAALEFYYREVNPALRDTLAIGDRLREVAFLAMQGTGLAARDGARHATGVILLIALGSLILAVLAALYLTRTILRPIRSLTDSAIALREGKFQHQVPVTTDDELGQLAREFNDMADSIAAFQRANLSELMRVKSLMEASLMALPEGVILVRHDGRIESINPRARQLLNLTPDADGLPLGEVRLPDAVMPGPGPEPGTDASAATVVLPAVAISTFVHGGLVLEATRTALPEEGANPPGFLVILRDITQRQLAAS